MEIKLESNRKIIFNLILPSIIVLTIAIIGVLITFLIFKENIDFYFLIILVLFDISYIVIFLIVKIKKRPMFIFNEEKIIINKNKLEKIILVKNIEYMHYYSYRWHYFITIFFGFLNEGGAMQIHIMEKDGTKHQIGFISEEDAKRLKLIYTNLLTINYLKKR